MSAPCFHQSPGIVGEVCPGTEDFSSGWAPLYLWGLEKIPALITLTDTQFKLIHVAGRQRVSCNQLQLFIPSRGEAHPWQGEASVCEGFAVRSHRPNLVGITAQGGCVQRFVLREKGIVGGYSWPFSGEITCDGFFSSPLVDVHG